MSSLYEYVGNLHMHTPYSDGELYHDEIAQAALAAQLDFVIVTDNNVRVRGPEGYRESENGRRVLVLIGEEVHDVTIRPQANHLLVFGAAQGLAPKAANPQDLINAVQSAGGFCFLAHPFEIAAPVFNEAAIPWEDWHVSGYCGIELWNYMSEFKSLMESKTTAVKYALNPETGIVGPFPDALDKWDEMLSTGKRVNIVGNTDAHGTTYTYGRMSRVLFPYEYLFKTVNTHILLENELTGDFEDDEKSVYSAVRSGRCFIGYDLPHSTRGFRFSAQGERERCMMGDEITAGTGVTLQASAPAQCELRIVLNGDILQQREKGTHLTHITSKPGAYRVEAYIDFNDARRGWIFSNPIYIV